MTYINFIYQFRKVPLTPAYIMYVYMTQLMAITIPDSTDGNHYVAVRTNSHYKPGGSGTAYSLTGYKSM